jgi:hypothetical protein
VKQAESILSVIPTGTEINLEIGLDDKQPMHDDNGTPMMYYDQLATISEHLQQIKHGQNDKLINPSETKSHNANPIIKAMNILKKSINKSTTNLTGILPKSKVRGTRLTQRKLKSSPRWNEWQLAEWQQLDQYRDQKMFGEPCPLPSNANILDLLWCYSIKTDGRLKARMVCNGRPSNRNTAIFGYTYAKSLDHVGARVFWAAAAAKNFVVRGADASNAFAEAEAPKIPLFVRINEQYREWWTDKLK